MLHFCFFIFCILYIAPAWYYLFFPLQSFDDLLELAENGDHRSVDMLVKDIYGGAYNSLGLGADIIASSFGKATRLDGQS